MFYKYNKNPKERIKSEKELNMFSRKLHNDIRDKLSLSEEEKPLLISAILIALKDDAFRASYLEKETEKDVASTLLNTIEQVLRKEESMQQNKVSLMVEQYKFIETHPILITKSKYSLSEMIHDVEKKVYPYFEENGFSDILGHFYREFLIYAGSDKKLGIVITPPHITDLFVEIADVRKNDVVFDNCCGTAGFLISAMKKMVEDSKSVEEEKAIKLKGLYGIELKPKMFTLACANMFVNKDGKSNIFQGDCMNLTLTDELFRERKATKALLNPPYSLKDKELSELHFIQNALSGLAKHGVCVAIVPMSCAIKSLEMKESLMKEHTLEAVMSMPNDLFHPIGVASCIMVWKAHVPHNSEVETWFGYWKDDGFVKNKMRGRVDAGKWSFIREEWLDIWRNRKVIAGKSVRQRVDAENEWCVEAYMETDYSNVSDDIFIKSIRKYLGFHVTNGCFSILNSFSDRSDIKLMLEPKTWKWFEYKDLFDISRGKSKTTTDKARKCKSGIPFISALTHNNGRVGFIKGKAEHTGNKITVANAGDGSVAFAFYQLYPFSAASTVNILSPKFEMNEYIGMFLIPLIKLERPKYSFGRGWTLNRMKKTTIKLPIDENENPDWKFMEEYIKTLSVDTSSSEVEVTSSSLKEKAIDWQEANTEMKEIK